MLRTDVQGIRTYVLATCQFSWGLTGHFVRSVYCRDHILERLIYTYTTAGTGVYALLDASLHHASVRGVAAATDRRNRAWDLINEKYKTDGGEPLFLRGQEHDFSELLNMCAQEALEVALDHTFLNSLLFVEYAFTCDVCTTHATGDDAPRFRHLALYKPDGFCYANPLEVSLLLFCHFCCAVFIHGSSPACLVFVYVRTR